jgi:hypothetical protein
MNPDVLELCCADEWLRVAEIDASAWHVDELPVELEDGEPTYGDYGVPLADDEDVPIPAWNLGPSSLRRVAAAAAFVPLLSIAEPVLAAPPTSAVVSGPSEVPATTDPSVWEALVQRSVVLTLADGLTFRGTVLSVNADVLVCARELDGLMVVVDTAQISFVHVEALPGTPAAKQPATGRGRIIMGSIATAIGGVMALGTLAMGAVCADIYDAYDGYICPYYTIPLGAVSAVSLAVGIPVLAAGLHKRKKTRAASEGAPTVSAFLAPGRNGAMAGVGVRF